MPNEEIIVAGKDESNKDSLPPAEELAKLEEKIEEVGEKETVADDSISEADRVKYGIPTKFVNWQAVIKWGSEAEKAKSKAESEKGEFERKAKEYEEMLLETQGKSEAQSGLSQDEKSQMVIKFQEDFSKDPIGTMQKLFTEYDNRRQSKEQQSSQVRKWEQEESEIIKDPAYKDIWDSEVKPELIKIAKERPYLNSLEEVLAIYERNKGKVDKFNKDDSADKKAEKKKALSESGHGSGGISEDLMKKIASAKTNEELEKLASQVK